MRSRTLLHILSLVSLGLLCSLLTVAPPSYADSGHARIIRLSLLQGDVRFARDVQGDPLASQTATWEAAEPNLPIRQGYVLATDKGRAEVEFENGAMAFLGENTVLEFYDLSLADGAKTTRLVLRQGTASFYVNPANGDYFSVTGGDFTVEAAARTTFRFDNSAGGSSVDVSKGRVSVLHKKKTTELAKGQSFSMQAGDDDSINVGRLPEGDDFDRWVSGRIDSVSTATVAAQQYVNSQYYTSGLADLYTYGAWYPMAGYGNCWRPYGVGFGWSPFASGGWYTDPFFGLAFIGNQPWGWLPYHYGAWIFDASIGWLWTPSPFFYGPGYVNAVWTGATGVFVRNKPGLIGIVPVHPLDANGKTPINLAQGVFPVTAGSVATQRVPLNTSDQWKIVKSVPHETAVNLAASSAVTRVAPSPGAASSISRSVALNPGSTIVYDPREHRFINSNTVAASAAVGEKNAALSNNHRETAGAQGGNTAAVAGVAGSKAFIPPAAVPTRTSVSVPRAVTPPPVPRASESARFGGGSSGGRSESGSRNGWSGGSASAWRGGSSSAASSAGSARASGGSSASAPSGGGRPH